MEAGPDPRADKTKYLDMRSSRKAFFRHVLAVANIQKGDL